VASPEFTAMSASCGSATIDPHELSEAIGVLRDRLLHSMRFDGSWEGRLSSSALSTATAVSALALADDPGNRARLISGVTWLAEYQNTDGGWGDTTDSPSNLATTLLAFAALHLVQNDPPPDGVLARAEKYLEAATARSTCGGPGPAGVVKAIGREYADDRTFAVPILMNCALAGLVNWSDIPGLPFELAVLPHSWYKALRLHVVSYALPALIAIGLLIHQRHPPTGLVRRLLRRAVRSRVLEKLRRIQPEHGGFLEATPLTSFVAMGLTPLVGRDHPVVAACLRFLCQSQREDGAWPIDTHLAMWLTTAAVSALDIAGELSRINTERTARWIEAGQYRTLHPYTHTAPGGWAWTPLPGGVPDGDDTAGAILALVALRRCAKGSQLAIPAQTASPPHGDPAIAAGVRWLVDLQNGDGGWPTFCRGWGKLPFDRSSPDLTAHALRALRAADPSATMRHWQSAIRGGMQFLRRAQEPDGSWIPLWFGNQLAPGRINPVLGTSRVLRALEILDRDGLAATRGIGYLYRVQNSDGGWGGAAGVASSIEETAMAVTALAPRARGSSLCETLERGVQYLLRGVAEGINHPAPIGLYFSHLWYSEQLYPVIWTLEALVRVRAI
jgi:squalene-hopene/tetraprenyl-beta-curcumene cyclase